MCVPKRQVGSLKYSDRKPTTNKSQKSADTTQTPQSGQCSPHTSKVNKMLRPAVYYCSIDDTTALNNRRGCTINQHAHQYVRMSPDHRGAQNYRVGCVHNRHAHESSSKQCLTTHKPSYHHTPTLTPTRYISYTTLFWRARQFHAQAETQTTHKPMQSH